MALSPKQYEAINLMLTMPELSYRDMAEKLNIKERQFRNWRNENEEFRKEYRKRLDEKWEALLPVAVEGVTSLARENNWNAIKYILDSSEYAASQKIDLNSNTTITVELEDE